MRNTSRVIILLLLGLTHFGSSAPFACGQPNLGRVPLDNHTLRKVKAGGEGRGRPVKSYAGSAKNFLLKSKFDPVIKPRMKSFHYEPREIKATEARLRSIYDAAYLGLKGDSLALAAGLMPVEYRQLCQLDPVAELAEKQGRADSEITASRALHNAAQQGDAKAALAILQHRHEWSAKQEISVDIYQKISITQALADATNRVIEHMPMKELNGPTADL